MIRSKLTRVADGVVVASPSPRVRVVWHHNGGAEHVVAYLGFADLDAATTCYHWLVERVGAYSRTTNAGACKPRKAKRVDGCSWELKWHAPDPGILASAIKRDLSRIAVTA